MHKYQSLAVWRRAHALLIATFRTTDRGFTARARPLFDQIRRAVVSIEANIVEGYALSTAALFRRHVRIALGSAAEAETLVRAAAELGYLGGDAVKPLAGLFDEVLAMLFAMLRRPLASKA